MRMLDLFCCAGGAAVGCSRAGFEVVGVDISSRPSYPFEFIQADVLALDPEWIWSNFHAVHASPPCQIHSKTAVLTKNRKTKHVDLIPQTRALLIASGLPYVMENVVGAPMLSPVVLCGTQFGLRVYRHRLFELSFPISSSPPPHRKHIRGATNATRGYSSYADGASIICCAGNNFKREDGMAAMGVTWSATRAEVAQMVPPAYTEWLGRQLMDHILHGEFA